VLTSTCPETEYCLDVCRATNGAHTDICWAYKELCYVQCLKMCRFLWYTLWLEICNIFFLDIWDRILCISLMEYTSNPLLCFDDTNDCVGCSICTCFS
jgi:hypothetical protein